MTPEAANRLDQFFAALRTAPRALLLLDYDGTLAPFRVDRFKAKPFSGVTELLRRIQKQGSTRMTVITGRPAGEIAPLLGLDPPLEVWGLHGAERLYPDGRRELENASPATVEKLDELRAMLRRDSFGGLFEDKANAVVMHWRGLPTRKAQWIERRTRELFDPAAQLDGMGLLDFEAGVELRVGRDKGGAVEAILQECVASEKRGLPVAVLGDDLTDEAAFRAVNAAGAPSLSVLVRDEWRATEANIWLRPPEELRNFLSRWATAVGA
jgi:trehalose 6-phosphate synthase/trehalose 6-phosphate phosphatase